MVQDSDTIRISDVSEAVVHGILEVTSDGIWDWHANTGFVYRNPGWYRMLGYEPHSLGNTVFTWEKRDPPRRSGGGDGEVRSLSERQRP